MIYRESPSVLLYEPFQLWTEQECKDIILRSKNSLEKGKVYHQNKLTDVRSNYISWLTLDESEFDYCFSIVKPYHSILTWFEHPVQISRYAKGEFYNWHRDEKPGNKRKSVRHFTLTCTLQTAPGATFELRNRVYDLPTGHAVIFPSKLDHRANAPTEGERWAFTIWYMKPNVDL